MSMWIDWSSCSYPPQLLENKEKGYLSEEFPFGSSSAQELFLESEALIGDLRLSVWELDKNELIANPHVEDLDDRLTGLSHQILTVLKNWILSSYKIGYERSANFKISTLDQERGEYLMEISTLIQHIAVVFLRSIDIDFRSIFRKFDWLLSASSYFTIRRDGEEEMNEFIKFYVCREGWSQTIVGMISTDEDPQTRLIHINYLTVDPQKVIQRWENPPIRSGVGGQLLDFVTERARKIGATKITVKPEVYAVDFFVKQGFRLTSIEEDDEVYSKPVTYTAFPI